MTKRELLSPAHDTASSAIVSVQAATTRVKEIITECVSKGIPDSELTKRLNAAIAQECKYIANEGFREQFKKSLVIAARKWHYELSQTYRINEHNLRQAAMQQPLNVGLLNLLDKTPYQKQFEFRKLLDDGTNPGIPVIKDYQAGVKLAMKALSAEPPKIITTRNGRAYAMPARLRAEMAVRYAAAVENLQRLINDGVLFCWISSHPNCSPRCSKYQGKLYSLFSGTVVIDGKEYRESGTIDGIPYRPINEALAGPNGDGNGCISGYNCRHRAIEYERGSKAPADYTEAEIKREYAIDKQQRDYENRIRQMKQEEKQLRACGMEKEAKDLRKKWRVLTREYQIYSIDHNRAFYPYRCVIDRTEENGLTIFESDVIITSENIKQAFGKKTLTLQETIQNADEVVAQAFERNQSQLKIIDAHYKGTAEKGAYFDIAKGGILFDLEEDSRPSDSSRKQFNTYFHEAGHNLDYVIGKKLGKGIMASLSYRSKTFAEKIDLVDKSGKLQGIYLKEPTFHDMIVEETNIYFENCRKIIQKETGRSVGDNELFREIQKIFKPVALADKRQLADIFDGVTKGLITKKGYLLGAGHSYDYWKKHKVGEEAFAHFTSILATNKPIVRVLEKYFSKSLQIYKEIMRI